VYLYLPIAELSVNFYAIIAVGGLAGILSGLFGIGGGFLLTPMLIFMGIPAPVAVATSANQIIASAFSGFLLHKRNQHVDMKIGNYLVMGGLMGALLGIAGFRLVANAGHADVVITLLYISFLSLVSALMLHEARRMHTRPEASPRLLQIHWLQHLPWQVHFPASHATHSALLPISIGIFTGILVVVLGIGGGFIMLPAMLYLLHMPQRLVIGTSLYHIMFTSIFATMLHATTTHTVDIFLAAILVIGSVLGAQWGARLSKRLPQHSLRYCLSALLIFMAAKLAYGLFIIPNALFSLDIAL
jgi:uncharacterized protein